MGGENTFCSRTQRSCSSGNENSWSVSVVRVGRNCSFTYDFDACLGTNELLSTKGGRLLQLMAGYFIIRFANRCRPFYRWQALRSLRQIGSIVVRLFWTYVTSPTRTGRINLMIPAPESDTGNRGNPAMPGSVAGPVWRSGPDRTLGPCWPGT